MWSLILYLLFGIGQPANTQAASDNISVYSETDDGDGGETSTPIPPRPTTP